MSRTALLFAAAMSAAVVIHAPATAGPPLICHPVEIGNAESLPWGDHPFDEDKSYRVARLSGDTLEILRDSDSALVHQETLRRAALYCEGDRNLAVDLQAKLMARALDAEAAGTPDALAWLDAGYFAQCLHQLRSPSGIACGTAHGVVGYGWVRRALALRADDPELEFAAAMMTALAGIPQHEQHRARAKSLAESDPLVAGNLEAHAKHWPDLRRAMGR
ncbi:MAG: hypothetical protein ACYSU7_11055 [Planctomycetota bacterium]